MTALVAVETAILAVLSLLVIGLLRAYATILNRLHALEAASPSAPFSTMDGIPAPAARIEGRDEWAPAHDIAGVGLSGEVVSLRTVGVEHDTVIVFLSSGCAGCAGFWADLGRPSAWPLPPQSRLVVVTKGPDDESPSALARLCPFGVDVVMSSAAWADFAVPGSPFVVVVDGRTGRVKGEGSGQSLAQVNSLIVQTTEDAHRRRAGGKPTGDVERERDVDRILYAAGIQVGDPSLYQNAEPGELR